MAVIPIKTIEFIKSAAGRDQFISDGLPQVAMIGRSNVGKSSVINCLTGRKTLARVSSSPGKTAQVNYFLIDGRYYLVDLPGYGYAKVSKAEKERWGNLMEEFFALPEQLSMGILLVDIRHKPTGDDVQMAEVMRGAPYRRVVLANKLDKLKKSQIEPSLALIRETLSLSKEEPLFPFSAEKGIGKTEVVRYIESELG